VFLVGARQVTLMVAYRIYPDRPGLQNMLLIGFFGDAKSE
jgi:hypothetical protein